MESIKEFYNRYSPENCFFYKLKQGREVANVLIRPENYGSFDRILATEKEMDILKSNNYVLCGIYQNLATKCREVYVYGVSFPIPKSCFHQK